MKRNLITIFSTVLLGLFASAILVGCNDEDVPDPKLTKARDDQRRAMMEAQQKGQPAGGGGAAPAPAPAPAAGTEPAPATK